MVPLPLIKYGIILAVILSVVGGIWFKIHHLTSQLNEALEQVTELTLKFERSQQDLVEATQSKAALVSSLEAAEAQRKKVQADLDITLKRFRAQKPPVECKAAIDWAVDNKGDLEWSK